MLYRSRLETRNLIRRLSDCEGETALFRHPDSDLNESINRAIMELYRVSSVENGDTGNRWLALTTFNTVAGQSLYPVPADFFRIAEITAQYGDHKLSLTPFNSEDRALLTDATNIYEEPRYWRMQGENVELLPVGAATHLVELWYVAHPGGVYSDAQMYDTMLLFDDFVAFYVAREIAIKDKSWDLVDRIGGWLDKRENAIQKAARQRGTRGAKVRDVYQETRANCRRRWL